MCSLRSIVILIALLAPFAHFCGHYSVSGICDFYVLLCVPCVLCGYSSSRSSRDRRQLRQREVAVRRRLLQLDQVAFRVAAVDRFHVTDIDGARLTERHPEAFEARVLAFDVGDIDAEMRVALVVRLQGL